MTVREVLTRILEAEQREVEIRDYALKNLREDERAQWREGYKLRAESTAEAIERHQRKRDYAAQNAEALLSAIARFTEEEE